MTEVFKVLPERLEGLVAAFTKINRRAAKLGVAGVTYTIGTLQTVVEKVEGQPNRVRAWHDVEVSTEVVSLAGWSFIGTLDHTSEAGVVLRAVPGENLPVEFRTAQPVCNHCGVNRRRNETFIVRHEDSTIKQIGRQCLRDFLGVDPTRAARMAEFAMLARDAALEAWDGDGTSRNYTGLDEFMVAVATAIRVFGWRSRKTAREFGKSATADDAFAILYPGRPDNRTQAEKDAVRASEADKAQAAAAIEWARNLRNGHELNDYEHNVAVVASGEVITHKTAGIAASIIPAYARATEQEINRRKAMAESNYVGTIGKRQDFTNLTVRSTHSFETQFGVTTIVNFVDDAGNRIKWFASSNPGCAQGDVVNIKATVKAHDEYKGIKETTVTRAKVTAVEPPADDAGTMGDDSFLSK